MALRGVRRGVLGTESESPRAPGVAGARLRRGVGGSDGRRLSRTARSSRLSRASSAAADTCRRRPSASRRAPSSSSRASRNDLRHSRRPPRRPSPSSPVPSPPSTRSLIHSFAQKEGKKGRTKERKKPFTTQHEQGKTPRKRNTSSPKPLTFTRRCFFVFPCRWILFRVVIQTYGSVGGSVAVGGAVSETDDDEGEEAGCCGCS